MTYLDDAGLFNAAQEPFIVAAGIMIDADKCMMLVENHLAALVEKHIPAEDRDGFIFHAAELWSGNGYFKDREKWPREPRLGILAELAAMPVQFDLVVPWSCQDRKFIQYYNFPDSVTAFERERQVFVDVVARFCDCVEERMREWFPGEVTIVVSEDRDSVRSPLKEMHTVYKDPKKVAEWSPYPMVNFPFTHIKDALHFAKKTESPYLQIADTCTFIIKKRLEENELIRPFYAAIKPALAVLPKGERGEVASW